MGFFCFLPPGAGEPAAAAVAAPTALTMPRCAFRLGAAATLRCNVEAREPYIPGAVLRVATRGSGSLRCERSCPVAQPQENTGWISVSSDTSYIYINSVDWELQEVVPPGSHMKSVLNPIN